MLKMQPVLGTNILIKGQSILYEYIGPNPIYNQFIRWKRKPIWLPTAKSKLFRVPKRPVIPQEEAREIQRLFNNYRTYMNSIKVLATELLKEIEVKYDEATIKLQKEQDFIDCQAINDAWNKERAVNREERLERQKEQQSENILRSLMIEEERHKQILEKAKEHVKEIQAIAPTLITKNNIDEAIDKALSNPVDHNFALDLDGNIHTDLPQSQEKVEVQQ